VRRGLANMKIQAYLTATAINLKRLAAAIAALLWALAAVLLDLAARSRGQRAAAWHQRWPEEGSSTAPSTRHDKARLKDMDQAGGSPCRPAALNRAAQPRPDTRPHSIRVPQGQKPSCATGGNHTRQTWPDRSPVL
jgi:hypothetical protein